MVNEINHPKGANVNNQLEQRLSAPTRTLQNMQLEHQQLLSEMEVLRQRANELQLLNSVQEVQQQQHQFEQHEQTTVIVEGSLKEEKQSSYAHESHEAETISVKNNSLEENITKVTDDVKETATAANYIQEKLNEIALLKAQYNKVENLINTTKKIEEHLARTESITTHVVSDVKNTQEHEETVTMNTSSTSTTEEKRQLLNAMADMFEDLSGDLRDQVSNLQGERQRIRALKEELLAQRKQPE